MLLRMKKVVGALAVFGVCALVACNVRIAEDASYADVSIAGLTFRIPLGNTFNVRAAQPKVRQGVQVTNLYSQPTPPVGNRPANGRISVNRAVRVTPLGVGKSTAPLQGINGSFEVDVYIGSLSATDPCTQGTFVGTFHVSAVGSTVTILESSLDVPEPALSELISGAFTLCLAVGGDTDATVIIDNMDVTFGEVKEPSANDNDNHNGNDNGSQPPPSTDTGTVTGQVVNALTGDPIDGATVAVAGTGLSATTDAGGNFTVGNVTVGGWTLNATFTGFAEASTTVQVTSGTTAETTIGLVPLGEAGVGVVAVLTWGESPTDLDFHMSGPDGAGGRFHAYFSNRQPVEHAFLDLDDTSSFGPETMTIRQTGGGDFVAGEYRLWVHNYSGSPEFDVSEARITLTAGGVQTAQFDVSAATGSTDDSLWQAVNLTVETDGSVSTVTTIQTFSTGNSDTEL